MWDNQIPIEEFCHGIDIKQIEKDINSNLQDNINRNFLWESDEKTLQTMVKFVQSDIRFLANKVNMFSLATLLGKSQVLPLL